MMLLWLDLWLIFDKYDALVRYVIYIVFSCDICCLSVNLIYMMFAWEGKTKKTVSTQFAECNDQDTLQIGKVCRVSWAWHSANLDSLQSVFEARDHV
jgi:hypothetical protein